MIPAASSRAGILVRAGLIAALTLAVYWPALEGHWLWDDGTLVLQNYTIHAASGLLAIWRGPINGTEYLPVTSSLEWIEWHLWSVHTLGYHLVSVLLHVGSALLIWRVLGKLGVRTAWVGGLVFALHPLAVESVAWISELKNTLSLPPLLLAASAWIDHVRDDKPRSYLRCLGWFLVSMLAKPTALMFPFVLLLFAWWRGRRLDCAEVLAVVPFFAFSAMFGTIATVLSHGHLASSTVQATMAMRLATVGWQALVLLGRSMAPLNLLPLYPSGFVGSPSVIDALPWLVLSALIVWLGSRKNPWARAVLFGLGFFLLNLVPALAFIGLSATSMVWSLDHLVYLPLVGVAGLAAAACDVAQAKTSRRAHGWAATAMTLVLALLAIDSRCYASSFSSSGSLWARVLRGNPQSAIAHHNLGIYNLGRHRIPEAITEFREALRLKPDYAYAHNGLGNALLLSGDSEGASREYQAALAVDPHYAEAHNGLGSILLQKGQWDAAAAECRQALLDKPHYVEALCNLGLIDAQQGRLSQAVEEFAEAKQLRPGDARIGKELDSLHARTTPQD